MPSTDHRQTPSPFAAAGAHLLALGYHPIPIMARNKAPGEYRSGKWELMFDWPRFRDRAPSRFEMGVWSRWPDANIGIVLGTRRAGWQVIALDIDTADPDRIMAIQGVAPTSPMGKRGEKGVTWFYRAPADLANRTYNIDGTRIVDLLTGNATRQTVVPPSIHPRGLAYEWMGEPVRADDLPVFTADHLARLEEALTVIGWDREAIVAHPQRSFRHDSDPSIWRETNEAALLAFDSWVPALGLPKSKRTPKGYEAVAWWRPSTTGQPIERRKPNLKFHAEGIKDFGADQGYTALTVVMTAMSWDLDTAFAWLRGRLGLDSAPIELPVQAKAGPAAAPATVVVTPEGDTIDAETGEVLAEATPAARTPAPFLWAPPGLVGEIADWICATARKPNRPLAVGAALCLVGTMAGRKIAGPTRSATHLYMLGLGPTGVGKDHLRQQLMRLMQAAKVTHHLGPDEFISMPAIVNAVRRQPMMLAIMDEIGAWFARINNPKKSSGFEGSIGKIMRTLWGTSFGIYMTPEWAGREARPVNSPALSICGVSTPKEFFASMQSGDVINGMLNRFLLIEAAPKVKERPPIADPAEVPRQLIERLRRIYASFGEMATAAMNDANQAWEPRILAWGRGAEDAYRSFAEDCERRIDAEGEDAPFLARSAEMAIRLATIRAVGTASDAVDQDAIEWGAALALHSAERMHVLARDYMSENDHQSNVFKVRRIIAEAGAWVSRRNLLRKLNGVLKARDLDEIIKALKDAEEIAERRTVPPAGGPPTISYKIT